LIVLACADIHGYQQVYEWLAAVATERRPDAVVLAGDLFGFPDGYPTIEAAQEAEGSKVAALLERLQLPVLYVMGNDDWIEWDPGVSTLQAIHGRRLTLGDFHFVGYQYTPPFVGSIHEKVDSEIRADLAEMEPLLDEKTVLVTHGPARRALDGSMAVERVGSDALSNLLERRTVRAHIHGHVHRAFGRSGNHFNVAAAARRRAMLIDLGNMTHECLE
jgi:uncharacterized protein